MLVVLSLTRKPISELRSISREIAGEAIANNGLDGIAPADPRYLGQDTGGAERWLPGPAVIDDNLVERLVVVTDRECNGILPGPRGEIETRNVFVPGSGRQFNVRARTGSNGVETDEALQVGPEFGQKLRAS